MKMVLHRMLQVCLLFSWVWLSQQTSTDVELQLLYSWQWMDFAYESEEQRSEAIQNRQFVAENIVLVDADFYVDPNCQRKRYFVTTPTLLMEGYPATLSEVIIDQTSNAPLLQPFPSWQANDKTLCNGLISVFQIQFDKCGNLWVMDTGKIDIFSTQQFICPPKLIIYNLANQNSELLRFEFTDQLKSNSYLMNLIIESTAEDCSDAIAYIADVKAFATIVYNRKQSTSWRVEHSSMNPYPNWSTLTSNGISFPIVDGIYALALGSAPDNIMKFYYNCFGGVAQSLVPTSILKDQNAAADTALLNREIKTTDPAREGQSTSAVITSNGIMIYPLVTKNALVCWNTALPPTPENQHIIFTDDTNFQFITNVKLRGNELIIVSTMMQKFVVQAMVPDEIKYRILNIGNVNHLLNNTPCLQ